MKSVFYLEMKLTTGKSKIINLDNSFIEYEAYEEDESIAEIEVYAEKIYGRAFLDCTSLTKVTILTEAHRIDFNAFAGCTALREIIFPDNLKEVVITFDGRGVSKMTLSNPSTKGLIKILKQGYAIDLYYKGDIRDDEDHWR